MSVHHLEKAGELPGMNASKKLVLMAICDDASKDTRVAYPGIEKLTLWSGLSDRRVLELVDDLIRDGHLARRRFAYRGRRTEYIVFPTDVEIRDLDDVDEKLNAVRKKPRRKPKPVDNSTGMGATGRILDSENGCEISSNGCDSYRTPPVSTPKNTSIGPVPEVTNAGAVDNFTATGLSSAGVNPGTLRGRTHGLPLQTADVLASVGHKLPTHIDDIGVEILAAEILRRSPSQVLNPTQYVITALRTDGFGNEWLPRAEAIADQRAAARGVRVDGTHTGPRF